MTNVPEWWPSYESAEMNAAWWHGYYVCRSEGIIGSIELGAIGEANQQAYLNGQRNMLARTFNNSDCAWGQGECVPDCPCCKRMDELIAERAAGYEEAVRDCIAAVESMDDGGDTDTRYILGSTAATLRALLDGEK